MKKFTRLDGIAAPLPMINVDTDMIIPKQYLKTIKRTGLGTHLFDEMRYNDDGSEKPDFVLNREPYRSAEILITEDNFGCGSSREHAPWALADFGIRCIIAPSYADIFFNNCVNNGILAIELPNALVHELLKEAGESGPNARFSVDLHAQTITRTDGSTSAFDIEPERKHRLLEGLDPIGLSLQKEADISAYEAKTGEDRPWL
ncbi:MAG: 3-isopropylmalate dehydratase small subunit [Rhodospirillales bacterium]|nr:3-isopropylmalate dehydratase small subunit [Rhodospirillales bacterium]